MSLESIILTWKYYWLKLILTAFIDCCLFYLAENCWSTVGAPLQLPIKNSAVRESCLITYFSDVTLFANSYAEASCQRFIQMKSDTVNLFHVKKRSRSFIFTGRSLNWEGKWFFLFMYFRVFRERKVLSKEKCDIACYCDRNFSVSTPSSPATVSQRSRLISH